MGTLNRRHFVTSASALAATSALVPVSVAKGLDPKDQDIKFGTTGSIFGFGRIRAPKPVFRCGSPPTCR
jgi:hypothetical protein